ncbi:CgeB family protein [Pseudomonas vancouverensis]|uniref:CgeB family protein n=1 Tax=Pseudomonas vancouverensis TaxID=95300 RepID=UPI003D05339C
MVSESPPIAATVTVFEHSVVSRDCADALQSLGFNVTYRPLTEENVMGLMTTRPDYVLTVNFNQYICEVCELLKIPYLAWVIDTPCYPIYDKAINHSHSFTFIYDAAIAQRLRNRGVRQVYHLPVAANLERIQQIRMDDEAPSLSRDISFVANLTKTEYRTSILPQLSASTRERCASLIDSLDQPGAFLTLAEQLDADLIDNIKNESGYPLVGDQYLSLAEKLAYLLGREHSWQERINLIRQLERRFSISVHGNSDWQDVINCYAGHADHFSQMPKIFQHSRINLNLTRSFVENGLPMRVFDVLSCAGFLVTNDKQDLHKLFTDGKDLVIFRDTQDLMEICAYYLEHDEERRVIAEQGHATLAENHTFLPRMIDMVSTVQRELRGESVPLSRWYS